MNCQQIGFSLSAAEMIGPLCIPQDQYTHYSNKNLIQQYVTLTLIILQKKEEGTEIDVSSLFFLVPSISQAASHSTSIVEHLMVIFINFYSRYD